MLEGSYLAQMASLVGDPSRANMLAALMAGQALTATELAIAAGITPQTASGHLARLTDGKLLKVVAQGRHRYHRLASAEVARMLESLMAVAVEGPKRHRPRSARDDALAEARTCYDHLAGRLGVALADALAARGLILLGDEGGAVTAAGQQALAAFGVDMAPGHGRQAFCRPCLDWSERRWHVGGRIGAALARRCFALGWIERAGDGRAVRVTPAGEAGLGRTFGLDWPGRPALAEAG
ncbi:MAG TPA: helix-turn-helix transcriptional regulator [Allosphingosinicella sp.]|nr:helix-turn-helix transcriptional regulator [Allosphingosinicella sp.]